MIRSTLGGESGAPADREDRDDRALRVAAGQILVGGWPSQDVPRDLAHMVRQGTLGGLILFSRNIESVEAAADLLREVAGLDAPAPLWFALDQEGGRVQRLRAPFPALPPMRALGRHDDLTLTQKAGALLGRALRLVGFHQNFAPVVDVDLNPLNPVIGDRSFGPDPENVAQHGAAFIRGLQGEGVAACAKHFPGHGDTSVDSHLDLPVLPHDLERLRSVELKPFQAAVEAEVASIMTAHILFPALDSERPATMSPFLLHRLLRTELEFEGVVVSDDLEMGAIEKHLDVGEAAVLAVSAGCDQLLVCHRLDRVEEAHEALLRAVETGRLPADRVFEAAGRVARLKARFARPSPLPSVNMAALSDSATLVLASEILAASRFDAGEAASAANPDPTEYKV